MYGQMTAAGWFYIGTQGILGFTYETFRAVARTHFGGTLAGRRVLTAGLGGMGGAQGFGVALNGGRALIVEVDAARAERRLRDGWVDVVRRATTRRSAAHFDPAGPVAVGLVGNAADVVPRLLATGSSSTSSPTRRPPTTRCAATCPAGFTPSSGPPTRRGRPEVSRRAVFESLAAHVEALLRYRERGAVVFEYGNGIRAQAAAHGVAEGAERSPASWRRTFGRSSPAASARSAGSASPATPRTCGAARTSSWMSSAATRCAAGSSWRGSGSRCRACPRGSAGSASASATAWPLALNELVRSGDVRPARARTRSHGSGLGRLAFARDRGDARRERRDRRLARPLGAPERGAGGQLGRDRERRRRRRRPIDPLRDGRRRRRERARRAQDAPRLLDRSRARHRPLRRRRLPGGARRSAPARARPPSG